MFCLSAFAIYITLIVGTYASYDAYITSDGTNNPSCNQSTPCGLFQFVIYNIESGNIPDDNLTIYISGSNLAYPDANATDQVEYCDITLAGNITFILDTNTIRTASEWFGVGVLDSCYFTSCGSSRCTHNLLTVDEGANVEFQNLVWDHTMPLLQSLEGSTFHCVHCTIQHIDTDQTTFLLSNEATFSHSTFFNLTFSGNASVFELFPISELDDYLGSQQTDSNLRLSDCSISEIWSMTFIDIAASDGMYCIFGSIGWLVVI